MTMDLRSRLRALESRLGVGQVSARSPHLVQREQDANAADADEAIAADLHDAIAADPNDVMAALSGDAITSVESLAFRMQRFATIDRERRAQRTSEPELAQLLRGHLCADGVILVETVVPASTRHGNVRYSDIHSAALDSITGGIEPNRNDLVFIDTETTGLAGGSGTLAFLLGLARLRGDSVEVRQYFLTRFAGEKAMLEHALEWLAPRSGRSPHLVSFNGKTFDVPLLVTRYRMARLSSPLADLPHIDLLHRTRAAFGRNWPDCRLQTAERELLKLFREDDIPGHMIPQIWTDFLQFGETRHLRGVVEHNLTDILSLIALSAVVGRTYAEPGHHPCADALGLSRAHRRSGNPEIARKHLEESQQPLSSEARLELAALYARSGDWEKAIPLWTTLAHNNNLCAMERLAIYHEHKTRDYVAALHWTRSMMQIAHPRAGVEKRRDRLMRKSSCISNCCAGPVATMPHIGVARATR